MLALIAGRGDLPKALVAGLPARPLICSLQGSIADSVKPDLTFRLERLGGFLNQLRVRGVTRVCLCGSVAPGNLSPTRLDLATLMMLPRLRRALSRGEDTAARIVIEIFEAAGLQVIGAHDVVPGLLPAPGCLTARQPDLAAAAAASRGDAVSLGQAEADLGQSSVVAADRVVARETKTGTDAMLARLGADAAGAVFYKAPKPGQDRRIDLPVIGPETVARCAALRLSGLVIEAGGVMVLDQSETIAEADRAGLFLWVRARGQALEAVS